LETISGFSAGKMDEDKIQNASEAEDFYKAYLMEDEANDADMVAEAYQKAHPDSPNIRILFDDFDRRVEVQRGSTEAIDSNAEYNELINSGEIKTEADRQTWLADQQKLQELAGWSVWKQEAWDADTFQTRHDGKHKIISNAAIEAKKESLGVGVDAIASLFDAHSTNPNFVQGDEDFSAGLTEQIALLEKRHPSKEDIASVVLGALKMSTDTQSEWEAASETADSVRHLFITKEDKALLATWEAEMQVKAEKYAGKETLDQGKERRRLAGLLSQALINKEPVGKYLNLMTAVSPEALLLHNKIVAAYKTGSQDTTPREEELVGLDSVAVQQAINRGDRAAVDRFAEDTPTLVQNANSALGRTLNTLIFGGGNAIKQNNEWLGSSLRAKTTSAFARHGITDDKALDQADLDFAKLIEDSPTMSYTEKIAEVEKLALAEKARVADENTATRLAERGPATHELALERKAELQLTLDQTIIDDDIADKNVRNAQANVDQWELDRDAERERAAQGGWTPRRGASALPEFGAPTNPYADDLEVEEKVALKTEKDRVAAQSAMNKIDSQISGIEASAKRGDISLEDFEIQDLLLGDPDMDDDDAINTDPKEPNIEDIPMADRQVKLF
jgi:hypothetical protein